MFVHVSPVTVLPVAKNDPIWLLFRVAVRWAEAVVGYPINGTLVNGAGKVSILKHEVEPTAMVQESVAVSHRPY
jgi:hypothetical protein